MCMIYLNCSNCKKVKINIRYPTKKKLNLFDLIVEGKEISMEIGSGVCVSVISEDFYNRMFNNVVKPIRLNGKKGKIFNGN